MAADPPVSGDPTTIRSVAVTVDDVVTALEATTRGGREAVLRITPPFPPRARARLHVAGGEGSAGYEGDVDPIHVDPRRLVDDDAPGYPEVDATADRLASAGEFTEDDLYEAHTDAVATWRERVRDHVVDAAELDLEGGTHAVEVKRLG